MNKIKCIYCNNSAIINQFKQAKFLYECKFHDHLYVGFELNYIESIYGSIGLIWLSNGKILLKINSGSISLHNIHSFDGEIKIITGNFELNTFTPENFEEKIKTYIAFE